MPTSNFLSVSGNLIELLFAVLISCSKDNLEEYHKMKQKILNGRKQGKNYERNLCLLARIFAAQCEGTAWAIYQAKAWLGCDPDGLGQDQA